MKCAASLKGLTDMAEITPDRAASPVEPVAPIYLVATGLTHEGRELYTRHDVRPLLCDTEALYGQPVAPAVQEPQEHICQWPKCSQGCSYLDSGCAAEDANNEQAPAPSAAPGAASPGKGMK
jgi:hypothetical protein